MGKIAIALCLALGSVAAEACSCMWAGPLLKVAPHSELVLRGRVKAYHGRANGVDLAMDVQVIEVLKGTLKETSIRVWGDNGVLCRPYVNSFPVGTEWIFAVQRMERDYTISVCGQFWARVKNGSVYGALTGREPATEETAPERMSLPEFRKRLGLVLPRDVQP